MAWTLTGTGTATYIGDASNESITLPSGQATYNIDGGAGTDTVWIQINTADLRYSGPDVNGVTTLAGADGTIMHLANVEWVQFANGLWSVPGTSSDTNPPSITAVSPADGATGVWVSSNIVATFSEVIQRGTGSIILKNAAGTTIETFDAATSSLLSISGATLTINPSRDLAFSTNYFVTVAPGAIKDMAGNAYAGTTTYDFTTAADTIPPVAPKLVTNTAFNFLIDPQVTMQTSLGAVAFELNPEQAPATVANMLAYVNSGFYDNTLFHRVIPGFMVQGGGYTTGLAYKTPTYSPITLESNNGLSNLRGAIAMARTPVADSATTQFFVNHVDNTSLNYSSAASPGYAVFGKVVSGLSVIDSIAQVPLITPPVTTPPTTPSQPVTDITIISFQQTLAGSSITNAATLTVSDLEAGAQWSFSLDGGATWAAGAGNSFAVPVGSYAASTIEVRQTDVAGNTSTAGKLTSALVVETTVPTATAFSPADADTGVGTSSDIAAIFSEAIQRGTGSIILKDAANTTIETFDAATSNRLSISGTTLTINPTSNLANNTHYFVTFASGTVKDLAGNPYAGTIAYDFTTIAATTTGDDTLIGSTGNDTLTGSSGNDIIDGRAGIDTATYSAARSSYIITKTSTGYTVAGGIDGTDTLTNIERLSFTDKKVAVDLDGNAGTTAKTLGAVFGAASVSNTIFVGIGLSYLDGGMSYPDLMRLALNAKLGGGFSNTDEVNLLYQNLAGFPPSTDDLNYWTGTLTSGQYTQASLAVMAADISLNTEHINLVGLVQTGIEFV